MAPILPISAPSLIKPISMPDAAAPANNFQQMLATAMSNVNRSSDAASAAVSNYMAGGTQELHSTILATQKASLDFELFLQVRNKVASAYDEIMKMQI
jgi:flagellar hook-basal body complex protein FliE